MEIITLMVREIIRRVSHSIMEVIYLIWLKTQLLSNQKFSIKAQSLDSLTPSIIKMRHRKSLLMAFSALVGNHSNNNKEKLCKMRIRQFQGPLAIIFLSQRQH